MQRMKRLGTGVATLAATGILGAFVAVSANGAGAAVIDCKTNQAITSVSYKVTHLDGTTRTVTALSNLQVPPPVRLGDTIVGTFGIDSRCATVVVSGASYWAPSDIFSDANQNQQILFDSTTKTVTTKGNATTVSLTLHIPPPGPTSTSAGTCPNPHNTSAQAFNGNGGSAASGNQYASTCDGRASQNGSGNGNSTGKPCQGCVGNADNKNPPGQFPNGSDHNNGYECDGNNGVGKGNPAHTDCQLTHFQMEFVVGPFLNNFADHGYADNVKIQGGSTLG